MNKSATFYSNLSLTSHEELQDVLKAWPISVTQQIISLSQLLHNELRMKQTLLLWYFWKLTPLTGYMCLTDGVQLVLWPVARFVVRFVVSEGI